VYYLYQLLKFEIFTSILESQPLSVYSTLFWSVECIICSDNAYKISFHTHLLKRRTGYKSLSGMCFTIISYSNSYEELKSSLLYIVRLSIHTQLLMLETQYLCLCWVKNVFYLTSISVMILYRWLNKNLCTK